MTDLTLIPGEAPGESGPPDTEPYTSFSRLSTYTSCPRKFRLRYVDHVEEVPQGSLIGGSIVHAVIELAEENRWWDIETTTENITAQNEYIRQAFVRELVHRVEAVGGPDKIRWGGRATKEFPDRENLDWWVAKGPPMIMRACAIRREDRKLGLELHETGGVESEVRARLPTGLNLRGYVDCLLLANRDGETIVRDWKTGSSAGDPIQVYTYAWLIRESRGFLPSKGELVMLRQQVPIKDVAIDEGMVDQIPRMFAARAAHLELDEQLGDLGFMPQPSMFCGACTVAPSCPVGQSGWWAEQFGR